jgi:hypothetical protein
MIVNEEGQVKYSKEASGKPISDLSPSLRMTEVAAEFGVLIAFFCEVESLRLGKTIGHLPGGRSPDRAFYILAEKRCALLL